MLAKTFVLGLLAMAMLSAGGCANTMRGVGADVQHNTDAAVNATVPRHR
jgi:predicted small secreted protein